MYDASLTLRFNHSADRACTAADVMMGYEVLLGRKPENTAVVEEAMATRVCDFIVGVASSDEFHEEVMVALGNDRPPPHAAESRAPSDAQKDWLLRQLSIPPQSEALLRAQNNWAEWLSILLALPGFPIEPQTSPLPFKGLDKKRSRQTGKHRTV